MASNSGKSYSLKRIYNHLKHAEQMMIMFELIDQATTGVQESEIAPHLYHVRRLVRLVGKMSKDASRYKGEE